MEDSSMLAPEIVEKIRKKREERERQERPSLRLPLPEIRNPEEYIEQEEKTDRVVIIDMA